MCTGQALFAANGVPLEMNFRPWARSQKNSNACSSHLLDHHDAVIQLASASLVRSRSLVHPQRVVVLRVLPILILIHTHAVSSSFLTFRLARLPREDRVVHQHRAVSSFPIINSYYACCCRSIYHAQAIIQLVSLHHTD